jgi:anionic cell wall polymer biosynthesis LytR-Cps2A-Psr (LCP) family protein
MCIPYAVSDEDSDLMLSAGMNTLNGEQALAFVRARKQLSDGSDISRIGRQQQFLLAFAKQAVDARILLDPLRLNRILTSITQSLTTDKELGSVPALANLAMQMRELTPAQVTFITMPWVSRGDGENVLPDAVAAPQLWTDLQSGKRIKRSPTGGGGNESAEPSACP